MCLCVCLSVCVCMCVYICVCVCCVYMCVCVVYIYVCVCMYIEKMERICMYCNLNTIEDKYHVLLEYPRYDNLNNILKQIIRKDHQCTNIYFLLSVKNMKEL